MALDDLVAEHARLLAQRTRILEAMAPAVRASDLDEATREDLQTGVSQALDDAFFSLVDPIETDIREAERHAAFRAVRADLIDIRRRQR
ncbi:MAG: hypothetical protein VYB54_13885 [Pseudomonadota bacterium]|nr:hypothetical protein [Pseudomonadota bacterium]